MSAVEKHKNQNIQDYKFVCSSVWGETWSLTLREEHGLRVFENRVLRIFGPRRDEVMGGWRKLHIEEVRNFHSSPNIIRMIKSRWAGYIARMGRKGTRIGYW
jgi:hypothetical protein